MTSSQSSLIPDGHAANWFIPFANGQLGVVYLVDDPVFSRTVHEPYALPLLYLSRSEEVVEVRSFADLISLSHRAGCDLEAEISSSFSRFCYFVKLMVGDGAGMVVEGEYAAELMEDYFGRPVPFQPPQIDGRHLEFWLFHDELRERSIETITIDLVDGSIRVVPFAVD